MVMVLANIMSNNPSDSIEQCVALSLPSGPLLIYAAAIFVMRLSAVYCMQPRIRRFLMVCLIVSNICLLGFFGAFLKILLRKYPRFLW